MSIFMENMLWEFKRTTMTALPYSKDLESYNLKDVKAMRITFDAVKDHLIPHMVEKTSTKVLWDSLT